MYRFKKLPSLRIINSYVRYERETGLLYHLKTTRARAAGSLAGKGGKYVAIGGSSYSMARIIFKINNPNWDEKNSIHFADGNDKNHKIENLVAEGKEVANKNKPKSKNNKSGKTGVCFCNNTNSWIAQIGYRYENIVLGHFKHFEDACKAREQAEVDYGYHKTHGRDKVIRGKDAPKFTSKFVGVCFNITNKVWYAYILYNGIKINMGQFDTEKEAILTREKANLIVESGGPVIEEDLLKLKADRKLSSAGIRGVKRHKNGRYSSRIVFEGSEYSLGTYDNAYSAGEAFKEGTKIVKSGVDIPKKLNHFYSMNTEGRRHILKGKA